MGIKKHCYNFATFCRRHVKSLSQQWDGETIDSLQEKFSSLNNLCSVNGEDWIVSEVIQQIVIKNVFHKELTIQYLDVSALSKQRSLLEMCLAFLLLHSPNGFFSMPQALSSLNFVLCTLHHTYLIIRIQIKKGLNIKARTNYRHAALGSMSLFETTNVKERPKKSFEPTNLRRSFLSSRNHPWWSWRINFLTWRELVSKTMQ